MPTMLVRVVVLVLLGALAACSTPTTSPGATDEAGDSGANPASEGPASTPPTASATATDDAAGLDLSGGDPAADVWIFNGAGVIRVDATTGEEVGQRLFGDLGCRWDSLAGVGPTTAWILGIGVASIPEGGLFPPPPSDNPLSGGCVGRVPLDGGEAVVETFEIAQGERPFFWDGVVVGDDALFAAAVVSAEGGSLGPENSDLYRASADGTVEVVASGIVDIAVAGDAYYVIIDPDGDGFLEAALMDPGSGEVAPVTFDGITVDSAHAVESYGEVVVFSITTFQPFARGLVATDPDGAVLGSVYEGAGPSGSLTSFRDFWANGDAFIALADGVLVAPMELNAAAKIKQPCSPVGTPEDPPECRYDALYGGRDGAWVVHVVQTATPQVLTLRRYDAASRTKKAEVELPTLEQP